MSYFLNNNLKDLHDSLKKKEILPSEILEEAIDGINKIDPKLNSFTSFLDKKEIKPDVINNLPITENLFSGIPVAVKDNIVTKDFKTTASSNMLKNFTSTYDATVVQNIKNNNSFVIGKNNLDEFAMGISTTTSVFGPTKNPWNLEKVPGGSSGGSAAAVAAGLIPLSLGSDTGGSIRQPASFNGVVGMKPTYGSISRFGLIAFSSSLDQIGPITKNILDNAQALEMISSHDIKDSTSVSNIDRNYSKLIGKDIKGLVIGVPSQFFGPTIEPEVKENIKNSIQRLEKLGAVIKEVSISNLQEGVPVYQLISSSEASSNLQRFDGVRYGYRDMNAKNLESMYEDTRGKGFGFEVKKRMLLGTLALSSSNFSLFFEKAAKIRTKIINNFNKIFEEVDIIIGPTVPNVAFDIEQTKKEDSEEEYFNDILTIPVSLAGLPALSMNSGFNSEKLPIGIQMIGKAFSEDVLYQTAYALEQDLNIISQKPNL